MKFVIAFACLFAVCSAAALGGDDVSATVLRDLRDNDGINGYKFGFDTSNGISRDETGILKSAGEVGVIVTEGQASWTAPDGTPVVLKFTADENGYHPIV